MADVTLDTLKQYLAKADEAIQVHTDAVRQAQANLQATLGARQVLLALLEGTPAQPTPSDTQ